MRGRFLDCAIGAGCSLLELSLELFDFRDTLLQQRPRFLVCSFAFLVAAFDLAGLALELADSQLERVDVGIALGEDSLASL